MPLFAPASSDRLKPSDHGWIGWPFEPYNIRASDVPVLASGTLYVIKMRVPVTCTITNVIYYVAQAGTSLTSAQNFAGLYSSAKSLLSATADQTTNYGSTGLVTAALTAPQAVPAGYVYVALYFVGSGTALGIGKGDAPSALINGGLSSATFNFASTSDTGLTTALPPSLGTFSSFNGALWAAVS